MWAMDTMMQVQMPKFAAKAGMKSRSRRLGLETVSRPDFECLGLVSVSGKSGKVSSRSRLEQNF